VSQSETLGNIVPHKTTARITMKIQLLSRKPDSRERIDSRRWVLRSAARRESSTPKKTDAVRST
jgi:hypothetical protein